MIKFGYGGVVVFCAILSFFMEVGISRSAGIFYILFLEAFGEDKDKTAWILSTQFALQSASGPLASFMVKKVGHRGNMIIGSVLVASGYFLCSLFATDVTMAILSIGVLVGFGFGFIALSTVVTVNEYFDEDYRSLAFGISCLGSSVGMFSIPQIIKYWNQGYGWRSSIFLVGLAALGLSIVGIFMTHIPESKRLKAAASEADDVKRNSTLSEDFRLLTNIRFVLYLINMLSFIAGFVMFNMFLADHTIQIGLVGTLQEASTFVSVVGIAGFVGRVVYSLAAHRKATDTLLVYFVSIILNGLFIIALPFFDNYWAIIGFCFAYGFLTASQSILFSNVCNKIVGVKYIAPAMGFARFVQTAGNLGGGPLGSSLRVLTGRYTTTFLVSGALFVVSGMAILYPWLYIKRQSGRNIPSDLVNEIGVSTDKGDITAAAAIKEVSFGDVGKLEERLENGTKL